MTQSAERATRPALLNGLRRRCPACGKGALFAGYLSVRPACPHCGEDISRHRADDAPAWAHMLIWPLVALGLCLALLPGVKGAVIGYQWAARMHGFGDRA